MHGKVGLVKDWAGHPGFCLLFYLLCDGYVFCTSIAWVGFCLINRYNICYEHNTIGHQFFNSKAKVNLKATICYITKLWILSLEESQTRSLSPKEVMQYGKCSSPTLVPRLAIMLCSRVSMS